MKDGNFSSSYIIENNHNAINKINEIKDDETKIEIIEIHFRKIMETLGLDLEDDSLRDSPRRVAKMYVKEIFSGLNKTNKPSISLFENKYNYNQMMLQKDITLFSTCEHHFVPIIGKAHIAYFSTGQVIGLSKLNRLVNYYSRRPQQQERLTMQIGREVMRVLKTDDAAVLIEADHLCVKSRGVNDANSSTTTSFYNGKFLQPEVRKEFLSYIKMKH